MKKLLLALVALAFLFSACNKEGVYTPKKKLSAVYYQKAGSEQKDLYEDYLWDGNKLMRRISNGSLISQYFHNVELVPTYDGKRIVRVDEKISGEYVDYFYEGKLLTKLVYHAGNMTAEATVEHKDGKPTRVFFPKAKTTSEDVTAKLMSVFVPQEQIQDMHKVLKQNSKSLSAVDAEVLWTWDGDNVVEVTSNLYNEDGTPVTNYVSRLTYDNNFNPYAISWADFGSESQIVQQSYGCTYFTLSKNNIVRIEHTNTITMSILPEPIVSQFAEDITYEYDGKYPVKATRTEEGEVTGTFYYEYK
ncbi:MAG: hypothetical protein MJZ57_02355 [Bacteroidales bacterium]|nr:hypothetical protein [Bacteroidales bacterium]